MLLAIVGSALADQVTLKSGDRLSGTITKSDGKTLVIKTDYAGDVIVKFDVDDNPKSSRLLTSVLKECGFRVIAKNDPIEALALCQRTHFDLALLGYEMPLMFGSRLAQEIKFLVPDVPVVLISGRSTLPAAELAFVDAHFGFGTVLDDLLWTMRILVRPKVVTMEDHRPDQRAMTQWVDST